jgi:hypothetical protein
MPNPNYKLKTDSWVAKIAARVLKAKSVAIVFGSTIHVCGCSREEFLADEKWLKHELCHIKQYQQHGYLMFILKYLWESLRHGYYNNKFEVEARAAAEEC